MSSYGKKAYQKDVAASLRELQDILGSIHDIDITIDFVEAHDAKQLISNERLKRRLAYNKFVDYVARPKSDAVSTRN
jgi:CHAD domain-containing protein